MMETIRGSQLSKFPLEPLNIVADLLYYDGPFLSLLELEHDSGESYYFYYWCNLDERYNRWLIFRVTQKQVTDYLTGKTSLRAIISHPIDHYYFLGDMDNDSEWQQLYLVMSADLPLSYWPKENSWFDRELSGVSEEDWQILEQRFLTDSSYYDERVSKIEAVNCDTVDGDWLPKRGQRLSAVSQPELTAISRESLEQLLTTIIGKQLETLLPRMLEEVVLKKLTKPSTSSPSF
jgi:hypothetical protein